jgi:HEAT repeat protein
MSRFLLCLVLLAAAAVSAEEQEGGDFKSGVAALRADEVSPGTRQAILAVGKAAIPELRDLAENGPELARARAAVLLYRLGEAEALKTLADLVASEEPRARAEAVAALRAFLSEPRGDDPAASEGRKAALKRWTQWWQANRKAVLDLAPMSRLYAQVLAGDAETGLVVLDLAKRHGARKGMRLTVRRGTKPVCSVEVLHAGEEKSVARVVDLSVQTRPKAGDSAFFVKQ